MTETLRVVGPPVLSGIATKEQLMPVGRTGEKSKEALLLPLTMREKLLVCAIVEALRALRGRAEAGSDVVPDAYLLRHDEKQALLGLMVAFKDAVGCDFTEARWE